MVSKKYNEVIFKKWLNDRLEDIETNVSEMLDEDTTKETIEEQIEIPNSRRQFLGLKQLTTEDYLEDLKQELKGD